MPRLLQADNFSSAGAGVVFVGIPLLMEFVGAKANLPVFVHLFLLVFAGIGLWQLFGVPVLAYRRQQGTWYALTDRRLLEGAAGSVRTQRLDQILSVDLIAKADGSGKVTCISAPGLPPQFGQVVNIIRQAGLLRARDGSGGGVNVMVFNNIPDVTAVAALINSWRQGLR
jgi:hypothetical protein